MRVGVDRQPVGFHQQQHEESRDQEQVGRAPIHRGLLHQQVVHDEGQHGLGEQRDADEHQDQRGFRQDGHHHRAAGADAAIGAGGVQPSERDHERTESQDQAAAEDVAHVGQRQRIVGEDGDQDRHRHHAGERDDGRDEIQPGRGLRRHDVFVEQLPEVAIGLEYARALGRAARAPRTAR